MGETPLAGTNPWLEQNPRWHKPLAGTSSRLEQPSTKKHPALTGKTLRLEPPPAWKKPWPGYNPWLEQTPGWNRPLAGTDPWLETAPGWILRFPEAFMLSTYLLLQKFWLPLPLEEGLKPRLRQKFCSKLPKVLQDYLCPLKKVHFFAAVILKQSTRKRPLHFEEGPKPRLLQKI